MQMALAAGHVHFRPLLDQLTEEEWRQATAWWTLEPRGELRADFRAALLTNLLFIPHCKQSHRRVDLDRYRLQFENTDDAQRRDLVAQEYIATVQDMSFDEMIAFTKANYAAAGLTDGTNRPV